MSWEPHDRATRSGPGADLAFAIDAFEAYLIAARSLVRTHDQLDAYVWQSYLLIEKLLARQDVYKVIFLLEGRSWHAVRILKDGINGHRDATNIVRLITKHRARLEEQTNSNEIDHLIHRALELRFAAPSSNGVFLGAVEDMIGFEINHPNFLRDTGFSETCEALADQALAGPALSLNLIAKTHFIDDEEHSLASIVLEWMPEDYFEEIENYWDEGEGHLFSWRIPRMAAAEYIQFLSRIVSDADDEERTFAEKMLVSAARNAEMIET